MLLLFRLLVLVLVLVRDLEDVLTYFILHTACSAPLRSALLYIVWFVRTHTFVFCWTCACRCGGTEVVVALEDQ